MQTVFRYLGTVAAVVLTVYLVPGVAVAGGLTGNGWVTIFLAALVWSVISMVIKPILNLLTLPITVLTFGIFSLILSALLFWAMVLIVPGFVVAGFVPALVGVIVLTVLNWLIQLVV